MANKMMVGIITTSIGIMLSMIGILFALFMLPILASRTVAVKEDENISSITGLSDMVDLPIYGVVFGITIFGVGTIFIGLYLVYEGSKS